MKLSWCGELMAELSDKEMNILSTALVTLVDSSLCTRDRRGRFKIRCGDGKRRKLSKAELVEIADKLSILAGHGSVKEVALEVAQETGLR